MAYPLPDECRELGEIGLSGVGSDLRDLIEVDSTECSD
jgi:hypothetical protein